jgi:hypothetical protein
MTTPDNRALWELVEKWREKERTSRGCGDFCDGVAHGYDMCADAIQDILERPVVVTGEELERACKAYSAAYTTPTEWKKAMRAALESMVRGKS